MTDSTHPRGRPRKYLTEEERVEVRRSNDRKYYNQNPEAKKEKVKQYQLANKEYILQRNKKLYHQKQLIKTILSSLIKYYQSTNNNSDLINDLSNPSSL